MRLLAYCVAGLCLAIPALLLANSGREPITLPALAPVAMQPQRLPGPGAIYPHIVRVECDEGRGTAYRIQGGKLISVAHVTNSTNCKIDGKPIHAVQDPGLDFSIIESPGPGGFKVNCDGFVPGRWYFAVGFARGWQWQTMVQHLATYMKTDDGLNELIGPQVIPGMSGGIEMNQAGEAVGMVNSYLGDWQSFSQPLKGTSICR